MPHDNRRLVAFSPIQNEASRRTFWLRVGTAFYNRDGSINVYLDALPTNGKLQLREPKDEQEIPPTDVPKTSRMVVTK